jgi:hypothetical protein
MSNKHDSEEFDPISYSINSESRKNNKRLNKRLDKIKREMRDDWEDEDSYEAQVYDFKKRKKDFKKNKKNLRRARNQAKKDPFRQSG